MALHIELDVGQPQREFKEADIITLPESTEATMLSSQISRKINTEENKKKVFKYRKGCFDPGDDSSYREGAEWMTKDSLITKKNPVKKAYMIDSSQGGVLFKCKCGWRSGWIKEAKKWATSKILKGILCGNCNKTKEEE